MDELKPSAWDRISSGDAALPCAKRGPWVSRVTWRLHCRVEPFERAADLAAAGEELRSRRRYWIEELTEHGERRPSSIQKIIETPDGRADDMLRSMPVVRVLAGKGPHSMRPLVRADDPLIKRLMLPLMFAASLYVMFVAAFSKWSAWLLLPIAVLACLTLVVGRRVRFRAAPSLARAGRCPDCRYDLTGLPDAIPCDSTGGIRTGPRRCPECGAAWPLIPPPVPGGA